MQTTAVFAIVITVPIGAMLINTLGFKWLEHDTDATTPIGFKKRKTKKREKLVENHINISNEDSSFTT